MDCDVFFFIKVGVYLLQQNNNTNTNNNSNSSMNTNSYKDTTLNPNILPLLKHQLPRQELNESYTKKKCQYQPNSSCSMTSNHSFKFNQNYHKNKLDNVIEHSTIQQINNKLKCHYIQNKLDTIHNPIVYYSNLITNEQKYKNLYKTTWNHQYKRIYTLKSRKYKKKKNLLKFTNKLNKNNLIHLKSKLMKNEYFNKSINPVYKTNQIKTRKIENILHQTINNNINNSNNSNNNSNINNNDHDGNNLHNKIFESINTIYSNYAFNPFKTSINNQNNNLENKINDILKPITSSNEINQIVHCNNLLKKNNYLSSSLSSSPSSSSSTSSGSSSILTLPQLSSHLSVLPIKSLYDNEKLYIKQNNIRKHFQKLTNSIFNYNYTSNPIYSNSYYSINNDKPLDLRNPLQIHLNTMLYKNKNYDNNNNNNIFNEIEKLSKLHLSVGNFNSNEIWSTIFTLLNRKLNQFSQINQSKFHLDFLKTNLYA
ncbi:unnamed protein product [Schistosoma margrebowiei]|uniref:Uncharacterized protein n=1 Tax=Schistosoma margrebowiei TaxID=48269 RepID=A0AA85A3I9_9TREM|nr:unnamed protein product [Schistosoma margrebowiei]